jgi:alkylation response protein AidB-like acyl-CoA dehydrogenase
MNAEYSAPLRMIAESAADAAASFGGPARARRVHEGGPAWEPATWSAIAQLGWLGIAVPESAGGLQLGAPALCVVAEEGGRALLAPPLTMGMAAAAVLAEAGEVAVPTLLALIEGSAHVVLVDAAGSADVTLAAHLAPDGDAATHWLVACGSGHEFSARLLDPGAPGVALTVRHAVDGSRLADLHVGRAIWNDAPQVLSGSAGEAAWRHGRHLAWLGDAAYLCGLMDAALALALDYLRLRRQFGVPIGSFQALQHRAAACHVDVTATRALVHEAARTAGTSKEGWAAAAAVHRAGAAALRVTKEVVQFHGAIGFAEEHDAGLYLRRAMTIGARHAGAALAALQSR